MNPRILALVLMPLSASACALTHHGAQPSALGQSRRSSDLLAVVDQPGPITLETVNSADWAVDRSGLIDLHDPRAKAAGIQNGLEPIQVYFHVVRHPVYGTFIVDTGVERALRDDRSRAAIRGLVARVMSTDRMQIHVPLGDWLAQQPTRLAGVFLTHLHLDHVSGMPDVPRGTPIYAGPREAGDRSLLNLAVGPNIDRALAGQAPVSEWRFAPDPDGRFAGVVDVFGDGSFWALFVPGHTPGSTAYLARTPEGPVLLTGDVCHTAWGWAHDVAPGTYTSDHRANADSLARLERFAAEHPAMRVRLGHQRLDGDSVAHAQAATAPRGAR
jgi:glyoxylase-like metal-dependent hydrolase (beta-lactamase superfamily II)